MLVHMWTTSHLGKFGYVERSLAVGVKQVEGHVDFMLTSILTNQSGTVDRFYAYTAAVAFNSIYCANLLQRTCVRICACRFSCVTPANHANIDLLFRMQVVSVKYGCGAGSLVHASALFHFLVRVRALARSFSHTFSFSFSALSLSNSPPPSLSPFSFTKAARPTSVGLQSSGLIDSRRHGMQSTLQILLYT